MGKKGGPKTGGRKKGSKNRQTKLNSEIGNIALNDVFDIIKDTPEKVKEALEKVRAKNEAQYVELCIKLYRIATPTVQDIKQDVEVTETATATEKQIENLLKNTINGSVKEKGGSE